MLKIFYPKVTFMDKNIKLLPLTIKILFPRQSLKILTFLVKLSDSIFFLLGHSPIVTLI